MYFITPILLIVGGILAVSNIIVAKKPDAKQLIDKLLPYQAFIGVGLLVFGLYNVLSIPDLLRMISVIPLLAIAAIAMIVSAILLGFLFGMPQIAKWMPGNNAAEQKGQQLMTKLAPFQILIGLIGMGSSLVFLLYRFGILGPHF